MTIQIMLTLTRNTSEPKHFEEQTMCGNDNLIKTRSPSYRVDKAHNDDNCMTKRVTLRMMQNKIFKIYRIAPTGYVMIDVLDQNNVVLETKGYNKKDMKIDLCQLGLSEYCKYPEYEWESIEDEKEINIQQRYYAFESSYNGKVYSENIPLTTYTST